MERGLAICVTALVAASTLCAVARGSGAPAVPLLIDTDAGYDDIMAIAFLFESVTCTVQGNSMHPPASEPNEVGIIQPVCVTSVFGEHSAANASNTVLGFSQAIASLATVRQCEETSPIMAAFPLVPVSTGADEYLYDGHLMPWMDAEADLSSIPSIILREPSRLSAVQALRLASEKYPGKLDILSIGPLTNIALALHYASAFGAQLHRIVMMGGAINVPGNTPNFVAEWNIYADPGAAAIVFNSDIPEKVLIPMDCMQEIICTNATRDLICDPPSATVIGSFIQEAVVGMCGWNDPMFYDPVAAFYLLHPEHFTVRERRLRVILEGPEQGRTVEDNVYGSTMLVAEDMDSAAFFTFAAHLAHQPQWPPDPST